MVIFQYQFQYYIYDVAYFSGCNYHCHDKCERMVIMSLIFKDEFSLIHCTVCKVLRSPQVFRDSSCLLVALHLHLHLHHCPIVYLLIYRFIQGQMRISWRMLKEMSFSINYTLAVSREQTKFYLSKIDLCPRSVKNEQLVSG